MYWGWEVGRTARAGFFSQPTSNYNARRWQFKRREEKGKSTFNKPILKIHSKATQLVVRNVSPSTNRKVNLKWALLYLSAEFTFAVIINPILFLMSGIMLNCVGTDWNKFKARCIFLSGPVWIQRFWACRLTCFFWIHETMINTYSSCYSLLTASQ